MAQHTIVHELITAAAAARPARFAIRPTVRLGKVAALVVGLDHGNDAIKAAVLGATGELHTVRIPTAYREAELIRGGEGEVSYTVDGIAIWIGEAALRHDGEDLPIGPTRQRLIDPRLRRLLAAALVELLRRAGYAAGEHALILGFSIPNTEIVPIRGEGEESDRLGVESETRAVLEQYLKGACWPITRTDANGAEEHWTLRLHAVLPQAQTAGTVLAVTKSPSGATVTDIEEMDVIDIGGGDTQHTQVSIRPYQMVSRRLGDGTIRIARALKDRFPRLELNDVAAQQALISGRLLASGKWRGIDGERREVVTAHGQTLLAPVVTILRQSKRYVVISGGGVILLHELLEERLAAERKQAGDDYELINHGIASTLNAVGAMFAVVFRAAKKD